MKHNGRYLTMQNTTYKEARRLRIKRMVFWFKNSLPGIISVLGVIVIWELSVRIFDIKEYILPSPSASVMAIITYWNAIRSNLLTTLYEIGLGFGVTVLISIPIATMISYSKIFQKTLYPFMVFVQLIPKVAIAPLFVIWFGFGVMPKILMVFLLSFFPLLMDAVAGLQSLNPRLYSMARTMNDSEWKFYWKIKLPNALPHIFSGLKTSISMATVGAVVAEFLGADSGLGYLLLRANGDINTKLLFAILVVLCLMGMVFFMIMGFIEKKVIPWHVSQRKNLKDDGTKKSDFRATA
ncbi:MAG: ABC transporter permease [Anaerolineaceae bacterium]|nr:MAG: ABC transporter permease [Anaerolineaceae bacterium]